MSTQNQANKTKDSALGPGAAGAGGGTLLVLFANNLPAGNSWKSWLVICAPTASVAISTFFIWAKRAIERFSNKRALKAKITEARGTLLQALENPKTSEEHRIQLRQHLEKLELLLVEADLEKIKLLSAKDQQQPI